jgi:hypothetical protein
VNIYLVSRLYKIRERFSGIDQLQNVTKNMRQHVNIDVDDLIFILGIVQGKGR